MAELPEWIARFSAFCAVNYSTIAVTTAAVTLVMAAVLILVRRNALHDEDWVLYLGLAFGAFTIQYGLRALASWIREGVYSRLFPRQIEYFAQSLFSNLNSILFLLAALALLYRLPKEWWRTKWLALVGVIVAGALLSAWFGSPLDRVFDAALSAFCLFILSLAMYASSGTRHKRGWATLNLMGGVGYALLHGVYALVPWHTRYPRLVQALSTELARLGSKTLPKHEEALDAGIFALAFCFKLTLFVGALLVIMRCLSAFAPTVSRKILDSVKHARGEFLAAAGVVNAMGRSIGADKAAIYLRLPGTRMNQLLPLKWPEGVGVDKQPEAIACPAREDSILGQTMTSPEILWSRDRRKDIPFSESAGDDSLRSFVNVPLLYHGGVVGCLTFAWEKRNGFTATDVQRVRQIADFITPVVQTERWLRAVADLRRRLQHYNFEQEQLKNATFMSRLVDELHDVLAPYATFVSIDFGFRAVWAMRHALAVHSSDDGDDTKSLQELEDQFREDVRRIEAAPNFEITPLTLAGHPIGKIMLAVQRAHDPLVRPSLTQEKAQLDSIAVLVKDVVFDLLRKYMSGIVHELHAKLDQRSFSSESHWMSTVRADIAKAGLREIGVAPVTSRIHRDSQPETRIVIEDLREIHAPDESIPYGIYAWEFADHDSRSVIEVPLKTAEEKLFLAVGRSGLGRELEPDLPWRLFIDRLAVAADSSLVRIRAIELEGDALQFEMHHLLIHELKNHAEEFQMGIEGIRSVLDEPSQEARNALFEKVERLTASSQNFLSLAGALEPVPTDTRSAVPLDDVRLHVDRFYLDRLAARQIELLWEIDSDLIIRVPIHSAYLSIVSLMQNARDALGSGTGIIRLQSQVQGDLILLHVDDNGSGIPIEIREHIFELGFSTKDSTGYGLALVRRALNRYGGDLTLAETPPPEMKTRFTIRFPKEH